MTNKHAMVGRRVVVSIICGICGHEWNETGEDHLCHSYPRDPDENEYFECPKCKHEAQCEEEE